MKFVLSRMAPSRRHNQHPAEERQRDRQQGDGARAAAPLAECLEGLAGVVGVRGQPARAALLLGAAEALRNAIGAPVPPADRADYERSVAAVRTQLDATAFGAAWAEGRSTPLEQAITVALSEGD